MPHLRDWFGPEFEYAALTDEDELLLDQPGSAVGSTPDDMHFISVDNLSFEIEPTDDEHILRREIGYNYGGEHDLDPEDFQMVGEDFDLIPCDVVG